MYQKKYKKLRLSLEPRNTSFQPVQAIERNKIVVKLSLVPSAQVFEMNDEKQHINLLREKQKNAASSSFVYKDIFESNNDYVLISGVPGCGKTTLVETILYQWSIDEFWSNEEFQFVFIIYFRQLVKFKSDQNISCCRLLSHFYPGFDFSNIPQQKSLLMLDGFDELACKEDFRKMHEDFSPFVQAVYDLIDPNNTMLQFTRLLTSRPGSFPILFESVFNASFEQNLRIFEVIGFDDENIHNYVHNHLQNAELADSLLIKVKESALLQNFMIIPFYCWGFCYLINNEDLTVNNFPVTTTAIYANILNLFIRNHGLRNPAAKLTILFKSKKFQEIISILSKMAWVLYTQNKLIFNSNDLTELGDVNFLVESGLVIKVEADFEELDYFQFIHYSFHEFLCALHVFYTLEKVFYLDSNIRIMVAGLFGGKMPNSSSDAVVKLFSTMKASQFDFASIFNRLLSIHEIAEIVFELQNENQKLSINYLCIVFPYSHLHSPKADPGKSAHLIQRCYNHNISINILYFNYNRGNTFDISWNHDLLFAILTCCTILECHVFSLSRLMRGLNFYRIKEIGKLDSLYLRCYGLGWLEFFQEISSELFDLIRHIKCVKILMRTEDMDDELSWLKDFKSSVSGIEYSECSIGFYHVSSDKLEENRLLKYESIFNDAVLKEIHL